MLGTIAIDLAAALAALVLWRLIFTRYNRRRAIRLLHEIRCVFAGEAQIVGVHWSGPSRFCARLRVTGGIFQQALVRIRLQPRHEPFEWLWSRIAQRQEVLVFEADLECPPSFNLEWHNQRWCGRTRALAPHALQHLSLERCGPFVLTTRSDWQRDISSMMSAFIASRDCDLLSVTYRKTSPHFAAEMPLGCLAIETASEAHIFDVLRELASCGETSRF